MQCHKCVHELLNSLFKKVSNFHAPLIYNANSPAYHLMALTFECEVWARFTSRVPGDSTPSHCHNISQAEKVKLLPFIRNMLYLSVWQTSFTYIKKIPPDYGWPITQKEKTSEICELIHSSQKSDNECMSTETGDYINLFTSILAGCIEWYLSRQAKKKMTRSFECFSIFECSFSPHIVMYVLSVWHLMTFSWLF